MCTSPHYAKKQPFQNAWYKIHSNRNIFHKAVEKGQCGASKSYNTKTMVNNRAVKQMQSSKNSAFFTVLLMGEHFGQRILNSEDHTSLFLKIHN